MKPRDPRHELFSNHGCPTNLRCCEIIICDIYFCDTSPPPCRLSAAIPTCRFPEIFTMTILSTMRRAASPAESTFISSHDGLCAKHWCDLRPQRKKMRNAPRVDDYRLVRKRPGKRVVSRQKMNIQTIFSIFFPIFHSRSSKFLRNYF